MCTQTDITVDLEEESFKNSVAEGDSSRANKKSESSESREQKRQRE